MPRKGFEWRSSQLTIEGFIHKDKRKNQVVHKTKPFPGGQPSVTEVNWLSVTRNYHVLECRPITGRSHQIRVQLASIGLPLYGDLKYGGPPTSDQRLYLHCYEMSFLHPVRKEEVVVNANFDQAPLWEQVPKL
ncbi:MAG: RNA pseudouridine synthase [Saprospiraceae bacterium]|nr:RNA pseudouridine synthase [Saprospiraceae bacterium]